MTDTPECDRIERRFLWAAGITATAIGGLAWIVMDRGHSHGQLETEVALLQRSQTVSSADHDKLIGLTGLVSANALTTAANAEAIAQINAGRQRDLDAILAAIEKGQR